MKRRDLHREQVADEFGQCTTCFDDNSGKLECEHFLCSHCMLYYAWQQLERGQREFGCPVCKVKLTMDLVLQLGRPDELEKSWLDKFLTRNLNEDLERKPKDASEKINLLLHTSPSREISDDNGVKLQVPELRVCPSCYTVIMHSEGCYKITCIGCRTTFCFICLTLVTADSSCGSTFTSFHCQPAGHQVIKEKVLL